MKKRNLLIVVFALYTCLINGKFKSGDLFFDITSSRDMTVEVTYGTGDEQYQASTYIIPEYVNYEGKRYYVDRIGNYAFSGDNFLTSIRIPKNIKSIGNYAFSGCFSLYSVVIDDAPTTLSLGSGARNGNSLFADASLTTFYWGRPLSYNTNSNNGYSPIANQPALSNITIGPNITTITAYMFYGNKSITSIELPTTVTSLGDHAFHGFQGLTSFSIPDHITSVGEYAFAECIGLSSFTIPEWITAIGRGTFSGCTSLTSLAIPGHVTSIGNRAFDGCTGLASLNFEAGSEPLSLGIIDYNYSGGSSTNNRGLFNDCPLESVELNRNLSYSAGSNYGYSPFANISSLKEFVQGEGGNRMGNYLLYSDKSIKTVSLSEGLTSIGNYAFGYCDSITSLVLPYSLETIGDYAFIDCKQLTGLIFHPALKSIGNYAFQGCTTFNNFAIEEGEETLTLGNGASEGEKVGLFKDCPITSVFIGRNLSYSYAPLSNMKTLTYARFGNPVTRIPNYIFQGDTELGTVEFNNSCQLQSVGKYAFDGCVNLSSPQLPSKVTVFDEGAFNGCTNFMNFDLPEKLETIGSYAFQNCTGFSTFTFPASMTSIGNYAFSGCTGVKEVTFVDGEETLTLGYGASKGKGYGLFNDCPLQELYLGRTVSYEVNNNGVYGFSPFYKQEALESVTVGPKVKELPYCIFWGSAIKELYVPSSVRTLHSSFVNGCPNLKKVIILGATPPTVDNANTLLSGSAEASKFYVFFPNKFTAAKNWSNYADKIDACCDIYCNLTYSGEGHTIGYKTDLPIVLENRETETAEAGTYQKRIDVTYTTNGYGLKDVLDLEYTIQKAPLIITVQSCSRKYGEENPEFQFEFEGFVNDENERVLIKEPTVITKATADSNVGEYEIKVSGAEAKNYDITYVGGILTITQAQQKIIWDIPLGYCAIGESIELTATSTSGLEVTYFTENEDFLQLSKKNGSTYATGMNEGVAHVTASQLGNENYEPAKSQIWIVEIVPTGINDIAADVNEKQFIQMNGMYTTDLKSGLNIIRTKDGKTVKVLVK